jgi:hypothetical protein
MAAPPLTFLLVHGHMVQQATPSYVPQNCYTIYSTNSFPLVVSWIPYDNTGLEYQVERILNEDGTFNLEQYKAYSPLFLS